MTRVEEDVAVAVNDPKVAKPVGLETGDEEEEDGDVELPLMVNCGE